MLAREHISDTLRHKQLVIESGLTIIHYLYENHRDNEALQLARRCARHDDSKLEFDEMQAFLQLPNEGENMKNANTPLSDGVTKLIQKHWAHNKHHPEFFKDYHEMTEIDIMEMVCDWHARSKQYNTNFKEFVKTRQQIRFHFDDEFFAIVWKYCEIVDSSDPIEKV